MLRNWDLGGGKERNEDENLDWDEDEPREEGSLNLKGDFEIPFCWRSSRSCSSSSEEA